ncbi:unnamed protein product [Cylindrotheca closterium]|uniref:CRAL-TRIO domain-containing protein n=1 Tax=Cylindrotheca closterium TaxID=2856 RepID=A0AAD2FK06_9STRA|nr:unnamed protein product [Cylindrotheca closterium]
MGRRRKQKEDPEKSSSKSAELLPAFLLGGLVVSIAIVFRIYWACKDVPSSPLMECPTIISEKETKKGGLAGLFKPKAATDGPIELELATPNPKDCACRFFFGYFNGNSGREGAPNTCIPSQKQIASKKPSKELMEKYKVAFTSERITVPKDHQQLIVKLAEQTEKQVPDWEERTNKVQWGGSTWPWYMSQPKSTGDSTDLEKLRGGNLFFSYLRIMKWPKTLSAQFPFKLCPKGCDSEVALGHTLEWREKFKPWMYSPAVLKENEKGFVFFHGFSDPKEEGENSSHAIVWIRGGLRNKVADTAQTRAYVNTLERAVAASYARSNGRVGKFNVVLDGTGFAFRLMPSLNSVKAFVTMLQDHFPDKLGIILMTNLGSVGEMLAKMMLKLLSEEVRNKIIVLPHDPQERQAILNTVVSYDYSPTWLGGTDTYEFNAKEYYADPELMLSDKEALEYLETMPYHA